MKTVRDFQLIGKKVLVRCDFNVPLSARGSIVDDFRIRESLPTIQYIRDGGASVILMAHLGRPLRDEKIEKRKEKYSLRPIAIRLEELLGIKITFLQDCVGEKVEDEIDKLEPGRVVLLENLRFHKGETANDPEFARALAKMGDIYINNAFAVDHRAHASLVGIPQLLPTGAGLLLEKEVLSLEKVIADPKRPLVAIVGGTKIATKTDFLDEMSALADAVLIGNPVCNGILETGLNFRGAEKIVKPVDGVPNMEEALDIGPKTISLFQKSIRGAKTILWTGPLGRIEEKAYAVGSLAVAEAIIQSGAFSVAGGGDLSGFLHSHHLGIKFSHVSTGGGAMLAFLSGQDMPGLQALKQKENGD